MTMDACENRRLLSSSRRALLLGGASFAAWAYLPKFARAADGRDPRLIVIILRGALDGLATVAPVGDPDYAPLHGSIALLSDGPHAGVMLDSFFALHPSMPEFARMYRDKHAAVIHAVATPYRDRSHFDGQDVLESGFSGPGRVQSGWLNRALEALPKGGRVTGGRVIADWPGLKAANLYEGRDLAPTCDLRAALKGVLRDHLGLGEGVLAKAVFPDSAQVRPMQGLVT
jgi:uncharacterized protein (DUF1501 family)